MLFLLKLVVPVIFRKMFTDEVQKLSADVCLYVHAVGPINQIMFLCLFLRLFGAV